MIYLLSAIGLTSLVLGCMGYIMERPRKTKYKRLPEPRRKKTIEYLTQPEQ